MLKMSCRLMVNSSNSPFVWKKSNLPISHRNHRFNSNAHTFFKHHSITASAKIRYGRIFMHRFTNTVSHQFAYNTKTVRLTIALYGKTYISNMISCYSILYT